MAGHYNDMAGVIENWSVVMLLPFLLRILISAVILMHH